MYQINFMGHRFYEYDGYGKYGIKTIMALQRTGLVKVTPMISDEAQLPMSLQYLKNTDYSNLTIALLPPHNLPNIPGRVWLYTMTEGYSIPDSWVDKMNSVERVLVPASWLVDVFKEHGVVVPIHVVQGGIDPGEFPIRPPTPDHRPFTFLTFGDRGGRKGIDLVFQAFIKAFCDTTEEEFMTAWNENKKTPPLRWNADARLMVKVLPNNLREMYMRQENRIYMYAAKVASMAEVYGLVDCVAIPSKGEGWGFFAREAAAMGRPVITGNWTGHYPDSPEWATVALTRHRKVQTMMEGLGSWDVADIDELAAAMRWVYDNNQAAIDKAMIGAEWLREHQTWQHTARSLIELLEELY